MLFPAQDPPPSPCMSWKTYWKTPLPDHAAGLPLGSYLLRPGTFISRAGQEECTGEAGNNKVTALGHGNRLPEFPPQPLKATNLYGQDLQPCSGCFAFVRDRMKVALWGEASRWLPVPLHGGDKLWTQHG